MPREKLTKDFARVEFQCPCCMKCAMRPEFMDALQRLRDEYGKPIRINSGYRCANHNARVRGAAESQHLYGNAVDIACDNIFDRDRLIELAFKFGFTGKEISPVHVHLDRRSTGARLIWTDLKGACL